MLFYKSEGMDDDECQTCVDFIEEEIPVIAMMWDNKVSLKYVFEDMEGKKHSFTQVQEKDQEISESLSVIYADNDGSFSVFVGDKEKLAEQEYETSDHLWNVLLTVALALVMLATAILS